MDVTSSPYEMAPYEVATSLKPSKAFAAAFAVLALALAGCATGLGAPVEIHNENFVSRVEEGTVLASRGADHLGYAYTVRLRSGELVSINGDSTVADGTPVLVEYAKAARMIPQNATIGY
jgi:hypothetical protein